MLISVAKIQKNIEKHILFTQQIVNAPEKGLISHSCYNDVTIL